jgi:hypothetical protein
MQRIQPEQMEHCQAYWPPGQGKQTMSTEYNQTKPELSQTMDEF